ncbi:hypothetical protein MAM1_0063d03897 [Mucor ambiguus]|uniref:Myb-like domain-containing protein n=1 Tax=Mucor ambiguus TaxID=91626 RepID=A0A0C9MMP2_9FUNG|nr:hypothetical protein MAM1_0063d03897 [Mucor ambiguus]
MFDSQNFSWLPVLQTGIIFIMAANKRRKMRPNNIIALERAKTESLMKESKQKKKEKQNVPQNPAYSSASDSDETDNESSNKRPQTSKRKASMCKRSSAAKAPQAILASSSGETGEEQQPAKRAKQNFRQDKTIDRDSSASDSDETGDERMVKPEPVSTENKALFITSEAPTKLKPPLELEADAAAAFKTNGFTEDSSDEDEENENGQENNEADANKTRDPRATQDTEGSNGKFRESVIKRSHLVGNRLAFRRRAEYDNTKPAAVNLSKRLNDSFLPNVQEDIFVSDSDSEPDSGVDYNTFEFPTWQRTLTWNRKPEDDPWPKQRKFGYSDKLKLEKRIKKICKRENMTFHEAQEIFSSGRRKEHIKFFQKIAAVFPNIPLYLLVKRLKETYHIKRNSAPWSKEEIKQLEGLLKIHGNNAELLSTMMNRSPKNINDFIFNHKSTKMASAKWTPEEDELLAKVMAKQKKNAAGRVSFLAAEPFFPDRSQKQIYARYYNIRHRIQPDGTLVAARPATAVEELEYLKRLLEQVNDYGLIEESQLDYAKERGFVKPSFYLNSRANIKGFEKMPIKDILTELIRRQERIVESRIQEGTL